MTSSQIATLRQVLEVLNMCPNTRVQNCELPDTYAAASELHRLLEEIAPRRSSRPADALDAYLFERLLRRQHLLIPREQLPTEFPTEDGADTLQEWIDLNSADYRFGLPEPVSLLADTYIEIEPNP